MIFIKVDLPAPILAQHRVDLTRQHFEIDAVIGDGRWVDLANARELQERRHRSGTPGSGVRRSCRTWMPGMVMKRSRLLIA